MATVRVSAGFRPNKMLLSMRAGRVEGGRGVRTCIRLCVCGEREEEAEREGCLKA